MDCVVKFSKVLPMFYRRTIKNGVTCPATPFTQIVFVTPTGFKPVTS